MTGYVLGETITRKGQLLLRKNNLYVRVQGYLFAA